MNAFDYMVLARMVNFFIPKKSVWKIRPGVLAFVFVFLDIFSFFIQAIGAIMANQGGTSRSAVQSGLHVYMGGIGIQELFILLFLAVALRCQKEMMTLERTGALGADPLKARWRWVLYPLYVSLSLISIRIIFRLVEFSKSVSQGNTIPTHEVYQYVFDAVP